jgi:hypothetical protein
MKARALGIAVALAFFATRADAAGGNEASIIGHPGEHPDYHLELEPHGLLAYGGPFNAWHGNLGAGIRATIPLLSNGFIPSINNNIGIGFGGDVFVFNGAALFVPVVGQWNFYLLTHLSVFGEAGAGVTFGGLHYVDPIFGVGARFHFAERLALTVRAEYPALSLGLSLYL